MKAPGSTAEATSRSEEVYGWTLFCFSIFILKIFLFAVDPLPKFMMGDSGSYIWTALTGWIPDDRSYFYGYVVRWSSFWTGSLTSLLLVQLSVSAITAVVVARISRFIFKLPLRWSYLFGFLCAVDPLQLLWERYVMTETISLCLYALVIYCSLLYLRDRRLRDLVLAQAISVLLIGFRMSFLMLVQINTVLLPLLAFLPVVLRRLRPEGTPGVRFVPALRVCGGHLMLSVMLMFLLHTGYKRANGWLANREPDYLYATGITLLAFWSPVLQPEDAPHPGLADLIRRGDEFGLKNFNLRNSQRFAPDFLVDRLQKLEPNPSKADSLAKKTALHALWRDPAGILGLALKNCSLYWNMTAMRNYAQADFSFFNPPSADLIALLGSHFHLAHTNSATKSLLQWYYVGAWPYYFLIMLAPLLCVGLIVIRSQRPVAILLFVHISLMLGVSMIFGGNSVRFFQPISFMTILVIAVGVQPLLTRHSRRGEDSLAGKTAERFPLRSHTAIGHTQSDEN